MKRHLRMLMAVVAMAIATAVHADDFAYLTVAADGSQTSFSVSKISKITFTSDNMVMHLSDGATEQLPLASLEKMYFTASDLSAISSVAADATRFSLQDGTLRVEAAQASHLYIYNAAGALVRSVAVGAGQTEVSLAAMPHGVYIVRLGTKVQKVMSR